MPDLINELPAWIPAFNIGISVVGLVIVLLLFVWGRKDRRTTYFIFLVASLILLAGALFQANMLSLPLWILIGTGGRMLNVVALVSDSVMDLKRSHFK